MKDLDRIKLYDYMLRQDAAAQNAVIECRNRVHRYHYDLVDLFDLIILQTRWDTVKMVSKDIYHILSKGGNEDRA